MLAIVMFFNIKSIFRKILHKATTIFLVFPLSLSLSLKHDGSPSLHSFETRPGCPPGPRPRSLVLSGSPGSTLFFYKLKQHRFDKKKQKNSQRVTTGFFTGFCRVNRVTPDYDFLYFFLNPTRFQPRASRVPGWPAGLDFKTMSSSIKPNHYHHYLLRPSLSKWTRKYIALHELLPCGN